jgi:hypothetical protein
MKMKIEFNCNNAAFDDAEQEIKRILDKVSIAVQHAEFGIIRDVNGNAIGKWELSEA